MTTVAHRWEMGSLFETLDPTPLPPPDEPAPWAGFPHRLVGCGRDAIRLVLRARGIERLWVPSYFCQEVLHAFIADGVTLVAYPDSPLAGAPPWDEIRPTAIDGILTVNYFGLRDSNALRRPADAPGLWIEDHTHAPTCQAARNSDAHYCVASLRKVWPVPDGGVLWSPRGETLPAAPALQPHLREAASTKLAGMHLKRLYLAGFEVDKPTFRALLAEGEGGLCGPEPSAITTLSSRLSTCLPIAHLRRLRQDNFTAFLRTLGDVPGVDILRPSGSADEPFAAVAVFSGAERRARAHAALVDAGVYAARLWPLAEPAVPGVRPEDVALSERSFCMPLDLRYGMDDCCRMAGRLRSALEPG